MFISRWKFIYSDLTGSKSLNQRKIKIRKKYVHNDILFLSYGLITSVRVKLFSLSMLLIFEENLNYSFVNHFTKDSK